MSANVAAALVNAKTHFSDAPQNHELPQKKQLSPEARCIVNILQNCIGKVEIAAALPALLQFNSASCIVDKELSNALQKLHILVERLEKLEGLSQESDGGEAGEAGKRGQLERSIKNSVRDLFRLIRANPDAISGLKAEEGVEIGESGYILIKELEKFYSHVVEKLLIAPHEELQLLLQKPVSRRDHKLEDIVSREELVAAETKTIDVKINELNEKIQKIQSALQGENLQEERRLLIVDKQCQSLIKTSQVKRANVQKEIDQLNIQINNLMLEDRQAERVLREKNEKVETETEYLLKIFDDEMEDIQAKLELNETHYEKEEEELTGLEKHFSFLEVEYNQIQERRRLAEERRKEEMRELELKTKAAILAQAWWRGYSTRKALKNKGKSKKAKKGKGKKTK